MKKLFIVILTLLIFLVILVFSYFNNLKFEKNMIKQYNSEYEIYLNKKISGIEITSLINKIIDSNEKNKVEKDEKGFYIENNTNSILMQIKILDNDTLYNIETFYGAGMLNFLKHYDSILFECKEIKYNSLGKVNYIYFEQILN